MVCVPRIPEVLHGKDCVVQLTCAFCAWLVVNTGGDPTGGGTGCALGLCMVRENAVDPGAFSV